jgi:hypothetical protein
LGKWGVGFFGVTFCREIQSPFALCSSSHQFPFLPQNNSNNTHTNNSQHPTTTCSFLFCLDLTTIFVDFTLVFFAIESLGCFGLLE